MESVYQPTSPRSSEAPEITVGITAWREGEDLTECFASVASQSDGRWECVVVLDGGADAATRAAFDALAHPRLRTFRLEKNEGPYATRHRALTEATTGWYAHVDADDRLPPRAVEHILAARRRDPDASFVYGDYQVRSDSGDLEIRRAGEIDPEAFADGPGATNLIPTSPIRIDLIEGLGGYAPELRRGGADWDFWIGVMESGVHGTRAEGVVYERRHRPTSNSAGWLLRRDEIAEILIRRHPKYFESETRRERCRGKACEIIARAHRRAGRRREAEIYAKRAESHGVTTPALEGIHHEAAMPWWRFAARRLARRFLEPGRKKRLV